MEKLGIKQDAYPFAQMYFDAELQEIKIAFHALDGEEGCVPVVRGTGSGTGPGYHGRSLAGAKFCGYFDIKTTSAKAYDVQVIDAPGKLIVFSIRHGGKDVSRGRKSSK